MISDINLSKIVIIALFLVPIVQNKALETPKCGQPKIDPDESRIVGGTPARPYSWPWQGVFCNIGYPDPCSLLCGASLLSNKWAMTAAHCVFLFEDHPDMFSVKFGTYKWDSQNESGAVDVMLAKIHRHPNFSHPLNVAYDIALLELKEPIEFSDHISPVCLPANDEAEIHAGNSAWVTGWGKDKEHDGHVQKLLHQVHVPILDQSVCDKDYAQHIFDKTMFCAGQAGRDSCQGDSGGPLVIKDKASSSWYQHGIVSWGKGCAEQAHPGVYSRVSTYCSYINQVTKGDVKCQ